MTSLLSGVDLTSRTATIALAALALISATAASGGNRPTRIHSYVAFEAGQRAAGLRVRATVHGSCWAGSAVESHPYSWRCGSGRYIHDPCFSSTPTSNAVICPDAPWSKSVLVLRLTKPLPQWMLIKRTIPAAAWPWGIVTATGKHCFTATATATGQIAGADVTYTCVGGGLLAGFTHRGSRTWTIYYTPKWQVKTLTFIAISDVWL